MKSYSILIVGIRCYIGHIIEFVSNLKKTNPYVHIALVVSSVPDEVKKELSECADTLVIHRTRKGNRLLKPVVSKINELSLYILFRKLQQKRKYDIVNIHFATPYIRYAMPVIKQMTENIVISPWGSDVLRVSDSKSIRVLRQVYSKARFVSTRNDSQTGKCLIEKFKVDPSKFVSLSWGGEFFDYIGEHSSTVTVEEAKERFGLKDRYVITCGYNTQKAQRHDLIIDAINSEKSKLPRNLTLLLPRTYVVYKGNSVDKDLYVGHLKEKCKSVGLDLVVVEEHLDMLDLLKLRMATDIFVHIQSTDAGSRSVMEYVACNKKVVHGSWVKYPYLEDNKPSCYYPVDQLDNLGKCILDAYRGQVEELPQEVKDAIIDRGWRKKMDEWNVFFESLVS